MDYVVQECLYPCAAQWLMQCPRRHPPEAAPRAFMMQELEKLQPGGVLGVLFAARMDCPAVDITAQLKDPCSLRSTKIIMLADRLKIYQN
eukprot:3455759-Amphidinium_carterae.1